MHLDCFQDIGNSAKEVCAQVQDSMPMSQFANSEPHLNVNKILVKSVIKKKQGVFQVQDVVTDDDHMIFVVETPDFVIPDLLLEKKTSKEKMIGSDATYCGVGRIPSLR
ncbi:hypothetical protein MKX01_005889 [Papaver californicum]|nr:hypothetical protein MKX01_005889 [Papaver californicum]